MKLQAPIKIVRLKGGVLPYMERREWEFQRIEEGIVFLTHPGIRYSIDVKEDCVDWNAENKLEGGKVVCTY